MSDACPPLCDHFVGLTSKTDGHRYWWCRYYGRDLRGTINFRVRCAECIQAKKGAN